MADTTLILGGFNFTDFAIPERITFGGEQALSVKKLVGGQRVIDALGQDDADIEWSGRFQSPDAMSLALALDEMRKGGQPQTLSVAGLSYRVVVRRFEYTVERLYQVLYRICLAVVRDNTIAPQAPASTMDDLVGADMNGDSTSPGAVSLAGGLTDPTVLPTITALSAAIKAAGVLQGATLTALAPVSAAAATAGAAITASIGVNDPAILADTGYAAAVVDPVPSAGVSAAAIIAAFQAQQAAIAEGESLWELGSLVGRIETNLAQATG